MSDNLTLSWASEILESGGWYRSIAGEKDFLVAQKALIEYARKRESKYGLLVIGGVGVGKTALANLLYSRLGNKKRKIVCSDSDAVNSLVSPADADVNGGVCGDDYYKVLGGNVYLDDIGAEMIKTSYGNRFNRVGAFISNYHSHWENGNTGRMLITTNLDISQLEQFYSSRVLDRIFDMCIVISLTGKSKRNRTIIRP